MKKVLPKEVNKNKNTRITIVLGSMEGQDILKLVESIVKEKDKQKVKEKKVQQKILRKELFYKSKEKCGCGTCKPIGLKECIVCHKIKRSVCSKASCIIDGKKPKMLTTATTVSRKLDYNDEMDICESDAYDLEEESEVEDSEVD